MIGQTISHYEILDKLGEGGMSLPALPFRQAGTGARLTYGLYDDRNDYFSL